MAGCKEGTVIINQTRTKQWIDLLASVFLEHLAIGGVANGIRKIQGLGNFCSNLEISEAFRMSLEISFSCVSLPLGFSNFWPRGLGVSDFCFFGQRFRSKAW